MSIIKKIKNFIISLFNQQKLLNEGTKSDKSGTKIDSFIDSLQKDYQNGLNKQKILNEIDKNPNLIDSLSYKRLLQLNKLYNDKINELETKLNILKINQA